MSETQAHLTKSVESVASEAWGYFCHEEKWCDVADQDENPCDCHDCARDYWGDDYEEGIDDMVTCDCGNCEAHNGSVLDVEYTTSASGDLLGVTVCVGTGGPHIELNTRRKSVIGYWAGCDPIYRHYSESDRVLEFWEEMHNSLY